MNPWLFIFFISLVLFLFLIDWNTLLKNLWAGIICLVDSLGVNLLAYKINYWHYMKVDEGLPKLFIFSSVINIFDIYICFMMGILFIQFLPKNYFLQLVHASVWTFFFRLMRYIQEQNNMLQFIHWRAWMYIYIVPVNMLALAWVRNIIYERNNKIKNENVD
jgi:hypothetical protein